MAFWESMTVGQMGALMLCEDTDVREYWIRWSRSLARKPDGSVFSDEDKVTSEETLSGLPTAPAGYFLAYAAAICARAAEKSDRGFLPSMEKIGNAYLNHTLEKHDIDGWKYSLSLFIAPQKSGDRERCASICWGHIWRQVKGKPEEFTPELSLLALMDKMQEANRAEQKERKINAVSITYLKGILNNRDADMRELCQKYCAASAQGASRERNRERKPFSSNRQFKKLCALLQDGVKQMVLTGAPGTGKTYIAEEAARHLGVPLDRKGKPYVRVQFHPSYDYTDFVEGLRPVEGVDGKLTFAKLDGTFKAFCRRVAEKNGENYPADRPEEQGVDDPNHKYFFLIDEINRAELSKVFGELMFCLEADKRGKPVDTQYQNLPTYGLDREDVFSDGFFIPKNVYIIGTMNDIDRSVENMDFALRRRFLFRELKVTGELLKEAFQSGKFGALLQKEAEAAAERIMAVNAVIAEQGADFGLNEQYFLSQGQFIGLPEKESLPELLDFAWKYRVESLLREYVRGEDGAAPFLAQCAAALGVRPDAQETEQ